MDHWMRRSTVDGFNGRWMSGVINRDELAEMKAAATVAPMVERRMEQPRTAVNQLILNRFNISRQNILASHVVSSATPCMSIDL